MDWKISPVLTSDGQLDWKDCDSSFMCFPGLMWSQIIQVLKLAWEWQTFFLGTSGNSTWCLRVCSYPWLLQGSSVPSLTLSTPSCLAELGNKPPPYLLVHPWQVVWFRPVPKILEVGKGNNFFWGSNYVGYLYWCAKWKHKYGETKICNSTKGGKLLAWGGGEHLLPPPKLQPWFVSSVELVSWCEHGWVIAGFVRNWSVLSALLHSLEKQLL